MSPSPPKEEGQPRARKHESPSVNSGLSPNPERPPRTLSWMFYQKCHLRWMRTQHKSGSLEFKGGNLYPLKLVYNLWEDLDPNLS